MALPIATPGETGDHLADLLLKLERQLSPELLLTTLAVRSTGGAVRPHVIVHHADGCRDPISPSDARLVARALRDDGRSYEFAEAWADSFDEAAETAEHRAAHVVMHAATGVIPFLRREA